MGIAPLPPHVLVSALQDSVHPTSGRLIAAQCISMAKNSAPISEAIASAKTVPLDPSFVHRTPEQWAAEMFPTSASGRQHDDLWKHEAASALHQWRSFTALTGEQVLLDQSTYLAALAAASGNKFQPHPAADYSDRRKA